MHSILGCNHPTFALPWRTLLPYLVALHFLHSGSAQLRVVAPSLHVTAIVGQDVVLRCHLSPCKDVWTLDIRWIQQRSSGLVHHYQNGEDLEQMEEYKGRTELLRDGLSDGNLDLRISAVSSSDSGLYSCVVQDGDGYAEAVVNLEVSDPFSQIVHPWKVALAVVTTLLLGSFAVILVFLYRKQAAQSRELKKKDTVLEEKDKMLKEKDRMLKRKDVELAEQGAVSGLHAANLKKQAEKLDSSAAELKYQAAKLVGRTEELEKQNSQLNHHHEGMDLSVADMKILATKLDSSAADLKEKVAKLVKQIEEVEKQNPELKEKVEQMDLHAADLTKKLGAESDIHYEVEQTKVVEEHSAEIHSRGADLTEKQAAEPEELTEEAEIRKSLLRRQYEKTVLRAVNLKKRAVEPVERTEAAEKPPKEQD